jgi:hypothetical protein
MNTVLLHSHLALGAFLLLALAIDKVKAWRLGVLAAALALVVTGAFNFMWRMAGAPGGWHAFIGIKLLLALHVIAMCVMIARGTAGAEKEQRWRKSALGSCALVVAIGLYFSNFAR